MEKGSFTNFNGFKSKFVYYEDLQRTHEDIYNQLIKAKIQHKSHYKQKLEKISANFYSWANAEANKEIELLKRFFNISSLGLTEGQMYSDSVGKQIVESINMALQFKEVYERHITRILGPKGKDKGTAKITAAQFFNQYFQDEFYKIVTRELEKISSKITDYTLDQIADVLFSDENIQEALYNTFFIRLKNSGDWAKNDENKGYEELFSAIEHFNKNEFLAQVSKAYHLDEFKQRLKEEIQNTEELQKVFRDKKASKKYIKTSLKESTTAKGTLGEIMGKEGTAAVISTMQDYGFNINFDSKIVGNAGGKADITMSFDLDPSRLFDIIEKSYQGRAQTVKEYKKMNNYLSGMKEGFIVYTNAKDYSLIKKNSSGYSFSGFSTGSDITLASFEGVISNTPGGSQELISQIMSTMEGAVYSDMKEEVEMAIAEKMAYFLFDDVLTIGKDTKASRRAIHLLLLDGVYIPLSYLFYLMSRAISIAGSDIYQVRDIFDVHLYSGKIAFPEGPWEPGKWKEQKEIAYNQIKIGATFLKSFEDIIREVHK